jgi:hypothetical protein
MKPFIVRRAATADDQVEQGGAVDRRRRAVVHGGPEVSCFSLDAVFST